MMSVFIFQNGFLALGWRQSPGDAAASWEAGLGPLRHLQAAFLAFGAIGQHHRLLGKSLDPQPSQTISACGYCAVSLA